MRSFIRKALGAAGLFIVGAALCAQNGARVYGPENFFRANGPPTAEVRPFSILRTDLTYTFQIMNGGQNGQFPPVSSAEIQVNGNYVVGPDDFKHNVPVIERSVTLTSDNTVSVLLKGRPDSGITINIFAPTAVCTTNPIPGQIALYVCKPNTTDVELDWVGGASPYTVSRSNRADFASGVSLLAQSTVPTTFVYPGAQNNGQQSEFFSVGDSTTPAQGAGPEDPPADIQPLITSISSASGTDNETITITGQGFSNVPQENIVLVDGEIATADTAALTDIVSAATTITAKIPVGATSGSVQVMVRDLTSNPVPFTVITDDPAAPFVWSHIRSMAYDPPTKGIVVSDGSGANKVYALKWNTGTMKWDHPQIDAFNNGVLSHRDSAGYFYIGGTATLGISRLTFTTASVSFDNKCPQSTVTSGGIRVVGARDTETDTVYCGYLPTTPTGLPSHMARKVLVGTQDFDYGNLGAGSLGFPSTGSAVFDKAGNLFVTELTQIRKITPAEVVSVVQAGFNGLSGLDWIGKDAADPGYLVAVDRAANKLFLIDLGQVPVVMEEIVPKTPFNTPSAAVFGADPVKGTSVLYVAEDPVAPAPKRILRFRDPRHFPINDHVPMRMLISKQETADKYPEKSQSQDGQITLTFALRPKQPAGRTIYFKVIDPVDTSPYQKLPTNATGGCILDNPVGQKCDNGDQTYYLKNPATAQQGRIINAVTDGSGNAVIELHLTDTFNQKYAGDNFRVQVSFDDFSVAPAPLVVGQSPLITAWKRGYILPSKMYQQGGLLNFSVAGNNANGDFPNPFGACGNNQLVIDPNYHNLIGPGKACAAAPCTGLNIQVELFDKAHPFGSANAQTSFITDIAFPAAGCGSGVPAALLVTVNPPFNPALGPYRAGVNAGQQGAGIGLTAPGTFPVRKMTAKPYKQSFMEILYPTNTIRTPYTSAGFFGPCLGAPVPGNLDSKWSQLWYAELPNHAHMAFIDDRGADDACSYKENNFITIHTGRYPPYFGCPAVNGCVQIAPYSETICDHEFGHQFFTNGCGALHDSRCDFQDIANVCQNNVVNQTTNCLMNLPVQDTPPGYPGANAINDRVNHRHQFDAMDMSTSDTTACGADRPDTTIRRATDPF